MIAGTPAAMTEQGVCTYLGWDSAFFGRRIARATVGRLAEETLRQIRTWCELHEIECLYFLADSTDPVTVSLAERAGFHLVDIRVTLERPLGHLPLPETAHRCVRPSTEDDLPALRAIARVSHRDSRFYHDEHFPESLCDLLYVTWIEKSLSGYADAVLVAERHHEPVGYISCHLLSSGSPQIGLFAVAENAQGQGLGRQLVLEALRWFACQGASQVTVVTQGRNVRGQRLYQRCGFVSRFVQLWYHYWPGAGAREVT